MLCRAIAVILLIGIPAMSSASLDRASSPRPARGGVSAGAVYGGVTPQGWPVVVRFNKTQRLVVHANIGLRLTCT